ncbi:MAG: SPFH domain-containing protein, partial [Planctomycetaceae bacterium]|nr:SPFH domain-containing protein [Planctomycetaceae bacterium]
NEIKNGAQLIVRPGQMAVFVHRGEIADVFEPGHYELTTDNLPLLSTLEGWKHGFNSPFRAEVYFVCTKQITDLKWGTPNPIMLRDPEFGPIRIRAFGTYAVRAADPKSLLEELVGTDKVVDADEVTELLRSIIISTFADIIGSSKVAALDLASRYREFGESLRLAVQERIDDEYGLEIPQLFIVNISLPESVEKALDTRTSMGVIGDMNRYQQFQLGQAMTAAAGNSSGGGAAEGLGLGLGMAMAGRMLHPGAVGAPGVPPAPPVAAWHIAVNGQTQGPFTLNQIIAAMSSGDVTPQTLLWSEGMAGWAPAGQIPQLRTGSVPPPPPPPAG